MEQKSIWRISGNEKERARTRTFPDALLHKSIMIKAFLTNQRISGGSGNVVRLVVAKESVSELVIPLFAQWLNGLGFSWNEELIGNGIKHLG